MASTRNEDRVLLCVHYVYYLVDPASNELLYVGRSTSPKVRLAHHERRLGCALAIDYLQRFTDLAAACCAERDAIRELKPRFNLRVASSPGHLGFKGTQRSRDAVSARMQQHWSDPANRAAVSIQFKGVPKTKQHAEKISAALKGRTYSAERRANIAKGLKGKLLGVPKSPEHRAKLAEALARGRETIKRNRHAAG
jgi:hypothetical protein